uniref:Uncharacterized protein n=1 Tax=Arundo donax TaxID=35708 RepID=A0A0A9H9U5_ARUDO
MFLHLSTLLYK